MTFSRPDNLLLAIDPASHVTGYAVLGGLESRDLVDAGLLRASEAIHQGTDAWLCQPELKACRRILSLASELQTLLAEYAGRIFAAAIEIPSGKAGTAAKHGARGSLTTYGLAAGYLWAELAKAAGLKPQARLPVYPITERQWTVDAPAKHLRRAAMRLVYGGRFNAAADDGVDATDAVMIGRWAWPRITES
jgi:hypothetical protein